MSILYIKIEIHSSCDIEYLSKLIFASCACDTLIARITGWMSSLRIGRRLPLQLQCSCHGQRGDVRQSVRGNYITRLWWGHNLTAVEGNASVIKWILQVELPVRGGRSFKDVEAWVWWREGDGRGGGGQLNLCVETLIFSRGQTWRCWKDCTSFSWRGTGQAGQLDLCVENLHPSRG